MTLPSNSSIRNTLCTLIAEGQGGLTKWSRSDLVALLENCLISQGALRHYIQVLEETSREKERAAEPPSAMQLEGVLEYGLTQLSDDALVEFALNPVALSTTRLCILDGFPDYWSELMASARSSASNVTEPLPAPDPNATADASLMDRDRSRNAQENRALPTARLAARQARPAGDAFETAKQQLRTSRKFAWRGQQYELFADTNANVFVAVPANATHLQVGPHDRLPLRDCDHEGMQRVEGITDPRIRRRIDAGESVGFVTNVEEDE